MWQYIMANIIETKKFDDEAIISLWREAFGDTRDDIQFFLDCCEYKTVLLYYCDEALAGMLFLVDAVVNGKKAKYIYAACTDKKYRRKGIMTELLDFAKSCYSDIILIPADEELVKYYRNRGFINKVDIDTIAFDECEDIIEYLFEGCGLNEPFALEYKGE